MTFFFHHCPVGGADAEVRLTPDLRENLTLLADLRLLWLELGLGFDGRTVL